MNIQDLTVDDLSLIVEIEHEGEKIGEVNVPVVAHNKAIAYIVHEAEEGLLIQMSTNPTNH